MANTASAKKRTRSSERKRQHNRMHRSRARTYIKGTERLITEGKIDEARKMAQMAISALDKAVSKGVLHKNNAARCKSRLMRKLNQATT